MAKEKEYLRYSFLLAFYLLDFLIHVFFVFYIPKFVGIFIQVIFEDPSVNYSTVMLVSSLKITTHLPYLLE